VTWLSDGALDRLREAAAWPELDDRYTITGVAGQGGMGTVYVARDRVLDRDVAVKVLDIADHRGARAARLTREAHILARLDHPGIVPVHDAGVLPDGRAFYVMKLVRGRRLDEVLAGQAPQALRLDLFSRVLEAVAFAHAHGVVHRDLKPENIMAGGFGEVFVMDWGVAQDGAADLEPAVVGTPGFMPPEQAGARAVDARADVFALGVMLAQLLGDNPAPALAAIAAKAQHPDPEARYQAVEYFAADMTRFRNQEPVAAYRESVVERAIRVYRRYELPILLVVAYIVMRFVLLVAVGV
jgi:serine/threonine protein kinase